MKKEAKIALAVSGAVALVCGFGITGALTVTGIGPESAALPRLYAEAERMGLPLTSADLAKGQPASPNAFEAWKRQITPLLEVKAQPIDWLPGANADSANYRAQLTASRKDVEELVAWVNQNRDYRATHDWRVGFSLQFTELQPTRSAMGTMMALAAAQAREGNRSEALNTLKAAGSMSREMTRQPMLLHGLVQLACLLIIQRQALYLAEIDPAGAADYLRFASEGWDLDPAFFLRGEVFSSAWMSRNMRSANWFQSFTDPNRYHLSSTSESASRYQGAGLPADGMNRAMLAVALRGWIELFRLTDKDGRFPDWRAAQAMLDAESTRLRTSGRVPDRMVATNFPPHEGLMSGFEQGRAMTRLTQALSIVHQFRDRNGRWPVSLQEAGIEAIPDPWVPGGFAQYRADKRGVSIWFCGPDGDDDGGTVEVRRDGDVAVGTPVARIGLPTVRTGPSRPARP
jgi:hypothetical protein